MTENIPRLKECIGAQNFPRTSTLAQTFAAVSKRGGSVQPNEVGTSLRKRRGDIDELRWYRVFFTPSDKVPEGIFFYRKEEGHICKNVSKN